MSSFSSSYACTVCDIPVLDQYGRLDTKSESSCFNDVQGTSIYYFLKFKNKNKKYGFIKNTVPTPYWYPVHYIVLFILPV